MDFEKVHSWLVYMLWLCQSSKLLIFHPCCNNVPKHCHNMKSGHSGPTSSKRKWVLNLGRKSSINFSVIWAARYLGLGTPGKIPIFNAQSEKNILVCPDKFAKILNNDSFIHTINYLDLPNISQSNLMSFVLNTNVYLFDSSVKTSFCFLIISLERAATFFLSTPKEQ